MAVSQEIYGREFRSEAVRVLVERFGIRLLVVDIENEVIVQWIESNNIDK
jgi:hypothetical protein